MLHLSEVAGERKRWVQLEALPQIEIQIRLRNLADQERFRKRMTQRGLLKERKGRIEIPEDKIPEFAVAWAEYFVTDWRGDFTIEPNETERPKFDHEALARYVFCEVPGTLTQAREAVEDEASFFSQNGNGSPG